MACAMFACAFFVADQRLQPAGAPATGQTFAAAEPPGSIIDTPGLGSSAVPGRADAPRKPASDTSARTFTPRRFAWAPVEGASGYHVEFFRGNSLVFAADTIRPMITVPAKWSFAGREFRFESLAYRWYVWPIVSGTRISKAVVQARLVVRDR